MRKPASINDARERPLKYPCWTNVETILQLVLVPLMIVFFAVVAVGFIFLSE